LKRNHVSAALIAIVLLVGVSVAPAHADQYLGFGVLNKDGASYNYLYGQLDLTPTLALGIMFSTDNLLEFSLWQGYMQGWYGEYESATSGAKSQLIEVGVWRAIPLASTANVVGWIGAQSVLGDPGIGVKASAEVSFSLTESFALHVGADTTLATKENASSTWFGAGYFF